MTLVSSYCTLCAIQLAYHNAPSYNETFVVINFDRCICFSSLAFDAIHVTVVATILLTNKMFSHLNEEMFACAIP